MNSTVIIVVFCALTIVGVAVIGFRVARAHDRAEAAFRARKLAERDRADRRSAKAGAADTDAPAKADAPANTDETPATDER